jgi:putative hydrolase of the HAD superfamily
MRKPDPEIFRRAAARLDAEPHECVMVGDNPNTDVLGAKRCGMRAVWVRNSWWSEPREADGVVDRVEDVVSMVDEWGTAPRPA